MNGRRVLATLIRREFWEHRGLWVVPLVTAAMLVVLTAIAGKRIGFLHVQVNGKEAQVLAALAGPAQVKYFGVFIGFLLATQLAIALVVLFFYLLDSLYSERKDRSILFWKSLPVSDAMTVASKAVVALLVVPLLVWLLSLLVSVLCAAALAVGVARMPYAAIATWHTDVWMTMQGTLLLDMLIAALWYAPIAAFLLLVSAFARRAVFLWAVAPAAMLVLLERNSLGTSHVAEFIVYRLGGFFRQMGVGMSRKPSPSAEAAVSEVTRIYQQLDVTPLLMNVDLWLGLAAAALMLYGAVRLRRWRDDT